VVEETARMDYSHTLLMHGRILCHVESRGLASIFRAAADEHDSGVATLFGV
jgi:hypothetical protein